MPVRAERTRMPSRRLGTFPGEARHPWLRASRALRSLAILVSAALAAFAANEPCARAEAPAPKPDYVPVGEYFPRGTWAAGFAAKAESSSFEGREPGATTTRSSRYGIISRNGYFIADRFLIGLRASYDVALHRVTLPSRSGGAPELVTEGSEQSFEVGPWFRYYFPVGNGWAIFGEGDWSYRTYFDEEKGFGSSESGSKSTGRGLAIGVGGGLTYFLTKGVAFDVAGRASFARLLLNSDNRRTRVDLADFGLLLGFQIYLPEFVF